jgi:hypothetical protein
MFIGPVIFSPASDQEDVYYAMCGDVNNVFLDILTGKHYVQIALANDRSKHPDQQVKDLAAQLIGYEIVTDRNYA